MTDHVSDLPDRPDGDGVAQQWLQRRHDLFVADLAGVLNLETGLREATLSANHGALIADLTGALNLDDGLAAIVPAVRVEPSITNIERPSAFPHRSTGHRLPDLVVMVAAAPPALRLGMRPSVRALARGLARLNGLDDALQLVGEIRIGEASQSARVHTRNLRLDLSRALPKRDHEAGPLALRVNQVFACLSQIERAVYANEDLRPYALSAAEMLSTHLSDIRPHLLEDVQDCVKKLGFPHELTTQDIQDFDVEQLLDAINDWTGADVRDVDLTGIDLEGVRWSTTTQWPLAWRERIERDSVLIDEEKQLWEIRPGTTTVDDDAFMALL